MVSRRTMFTSTAGITAGFMVSGCSGDPTARWAEAGSTDGVTSPLPSPTSAVRLTVTPAADATDILPTETITVSAENGTLQTVTVTAEETTVEGALSDDNVTWESSDTLKYSKTYTITATAVDTEGLPYEQTTTFNTLEPSATASITFQANALTALKDGGTYGVGQPVCVYFGESISDTDAAEEAMTVTTSPSVEGRWRWIDSHTVHWRPATYWKSGTTVKVKVNVLGVNLGDGVYGASNTSAGFTIGQSRIAIADNDSHYMACYIDGSMVRNIPVSLGKGGTSETSSGGTANYWTTNGPHVILNKSDVVHMSSTSSGITDTSDPNYYDEDVELCCRISNSGEYVHLADWNVSSQGKANTSHGCINVGPDNAQWFYDTFQIGDIVEVTNSPRELAIDNGLGDWTISWDEW